MMIYTILPTLESDLATILELNQAALPAVSSVYIEDMTHFLTIADYFRTIKIEDTIAGFLIALAPGKDYHSMNYRWFENKYDSFMYIDRIVIAPEFQGNGLGRALYDDLRIFSRDMTPLITCEVNILPMNEDSIRFHKKYGFRQVGTQETAGGKKEVSMMAYDIQHQ